MNIPRQRKRNEIRRRGKNEKRVDKTKGKEGRKGRKGGGGEEDRMKNRRKKKEKRVGIKY